MFDRVEVHCMDIFFAAFEQGPYWMYAVGGLGVAGLAVVALQTYLEATGRRLSPLLWWFGPASVAIVSLSVIWFNIEPVGQTSSTAELLQASRTTTKELVYYHSVGAFGALVNSLLCCFVAVGAYVAGTSRRRSSGETRFWWAVSAASIALVAGLGGSLAIEWFDGIDSAAYLSVGLVVGGGFCCAMLAQYMPTDDPGATEAAYDRWTAGLGLALSVAAAAWATYVLPRVDALRSLQNGVDPSDLDRLAQGFAASSNNATVAWYMTVGALLIAGLTVGSAGIRAIGRDVSARLALVVLLWCPPAVMGGLAVYQTVHVANSLGDGPTSTSNLLDAEPPLHPNVWRQTSLATA